jgi:hypothetical protein
MQQVGEVQQRALAQKRNTPESDGALKAIHVGLRDSTRDCATLARQLEQWRQRLSRQE